MKSRSRIILTLGLMASHLLPAVPVTNTQSARSEKLGIRILSGDVALPATGLWRIAPQQPQNGPLTQLQLITPQDAHAAVQGERYRSILEKELTQQGRNPLHTLSWKLNEYALGKDEFAVDDLTPEQRKQIDEVLNKRPWNMEDVPDANPPFYQLLPDFRLQFEDGAEREHWKRAVNDDVIAVELHPYVDDGKHWVLHANGRTERTNIDMQLVNRYKFEVVPVLNAATPQVPPTFFTYQIAGLVNEAAGAEKMTVRLISYPTGEPLEATWNLAESQPGPEALIQQWAGRRAQEWIQLARETNAPVLKLWLHQSSALYGTENFQPQRGGRDRGRTTSVFNVLGGRAAIRETLQMQLLTGTQPDGARSIPISEIRGVEVVSHPFDEMLAGRAGGHVAIADYVPVDRFMLHVRKPASLVPLLEDGGAFAGTLGSLATGNSLSRDLKNRYLKRLGMDEEWLKAVLKAGAVAELALILPDLFVVDGTDITVVARVPQLLALRPLLAVLGITNLGSAPMEIRSADGNVSFWATTGNYLVVGSNRAEIENTLKVGGNPTAENSLGRSAEFRYMLEQLPQQDNTRMYAYFSDSFIRRLVGPGVKIAQLRRMKARAEMEAVTAGALLHRLDAHRAPVSIGTLANMGYVPEQFKESTLSIRDDLVVVSQDYGTLNDLASLSAHPVMSASDGEAKMYGEYVEAYSRFWRQYFDPIAMRLDEEHGQLALTTFILPLLDSAMYDQLRQVMPDAAQAGSLRIPQLDPEPVFSLSVALSEQAWTEFLGDMGRMFMGRLGINPAVFDTLGPSVHFMVRDGDPVLALGSGDLLGAFGGRGNIGFGRSEMMMIPILLTALTRPAALFVELQNPELVKATLRQGLQAPADRTLGGELQSEFYQIDERDEWVYAIDVAGLIKLRFGLSVVDRYLVITNLPWSQQIGVTNIVPAPLNAAALQLFPANVEQQLSALFFSAAEQQRQAAFEGIGYLYPFMANSGSEIDQALARHSLLFGFRPVHPNGGQWLWDDGTIRSSQYGTVRDRRQPPHDADNRQFGLFSAVEHLFLNLQFEDTGLRTLLRWSLRNQD